MEFFTNLLNSLSAFAIHKLLPAVLIFVVGIFVVRILMKLLGKALRRSRLEKAAVSLILSVIRVVLVLIVSLIAASSLGIYVTGIVALASVLTLAVSLSVQDALTNLIGGFTLLYTKPFKIGDFVEIGGQNGTVQQIGLTYTQILTPDAKTVSMPNSSVVSAQIINYTVQGTRRVEISIGVSYSSDQALVIDALIKAAQLTPTSLTEPAPYAAVSSYGESTVNYILHTWCKADDYWTTLHTTNRNICTVFKTMGVVMTYPHLNIHVNK